MGFKMMLFSYPLQDVTLENLEMQRSMGNLVIINQERLVKDFCNVEYGWHRVEQSQFGLQTFSIIDLLIS